MQLKFLFFLRFLSILSLKYVPCEIINSFLYPNLLLCLLFIIFFIKSQMNLTLESDLKADCEPARLENPFI